jgi:hypothetical protein
MDDHLIIESHKSQLAFHKKSIKAGKRLSQVGDDFDLKSYKKVLNL